jgi:hypothetical protein
VSARATRVDAEWHSHPSTGLVLLVSSGILELTVAGRSPVLLTDGAWAVVPAGVTHRLAVLEPAAVVVHRSGPSALCPALDGREPAPPAADGEGVPTFVRAPPEPLASRCSPATVGQTWAGPGAIDCGTVGPGNQDPGFRCAMWAQEHGRAFFLTEHIQGIDSSYELALVRTRQGASFELSIGDASFKYRRCERFSGPSWRSATTLNIPVFGRAGVIRPQCVASGESRPTLPVLRWSCAESGPPPGPPADVPLPPREVGARPERGSLPWILDVLQAGPTVFDALPRRNERVCLAGAVAPVDELWLLDAYEWRFVAAGARRSERLHRRGLEPGKGALVYRTGAAPSPGPVVGACDTVDTRITVPRPNKLFDTSEANRQKLLSAEVSETREHWAVMPLTMDSFSRYEVAKDLLILGRCAEARAELKRMKDPGWGTRYLQQLGRDSVLCHGTDQE